MASKLKKQSDAPQARFIVGRGLVGLVLAAALLLRCIRLGAVAQWIDEWGVLWLADVQRAPSEILLTTLRTCFEGPSNEQMPFQYVLLNLALRLYRALNIEPSVLLIRLPFTILSFLSVWTVYLAARAFYDRRTALWATFFVALSFFHVYQSRDATSYGPLMLFMGVHLAGVSGWTRAGAAGGIHRAAFVIGAVGMLLTHMSSWFFLATEGLLLLGWAVIGRVRGGAGKPWRSELWRGRFAPAVLLILCAIPFLFVLHRALTVYRPTGLKEEVDTTRVSLNFLLYQLAHFGWGMGGGRLLGFGAVALGGVAALIRDRARRGFGAAHITLLLAPAFLLFMAPHVQVPPRYLTVCFIPLMILAGRGADWWTEQAGRLLKLSGSWKHAPAVLLLVTVAAWHVGPYAALFSMPAKLMPIPQLIRWLENQLPENGLYIWESGYNLREVPQTYPVQGRQAAWATMHSGSIRVSPVAEQLAPFARSIFQRFPLAALLATGFPEPPASGPWAWIGTDFARRDVIRNEGLETLHRYGFSPHGYQYPANLNIVCYFNRPEDLPERFAGRPFLVYPDGPGWKYLQTRDGILFACPEPAGALRVRNLSGAAQSAQVVIEGAVQAAGSLRVTGPDGTVLTRTLQPANQVRQEFGPFSFPPGDRDVRMEFWPAGRNALLIYAFQAVPPPAAGPAEAEP